MKNQKIDELINPSWIEDVKLLGRDIYFFIRDTITNATHLIARAVKVFSLMQIWGKGLASFIEIKLHDLRQLIKR